jgi:hypothetical protein
LCCPPFAGRVDSAGRTQAERHCRGREYSAPPNGDEVHDDDEDWNAGQQTSVHISVGRHPLDHRDVPPGCVSQAGNSRRRLGVAYRILRCAAGMDGSGQKVPTRMKVRLPRNRVVSTGARSMSCRPRARPFSKAASHARTDPLGLELFGIAQRACSCTPPATAPLIIPQLRVRRLERALKRSPRWAQRERETSCLGSQFMVSAASAGR